MKIPKKWQIPLISCHFPIHLWIMCVVREHKKSQKWRDMTLLCTWKIKGEPIDDVARGTTRGGTSARTFAGTTTSWLLTTLSTSIEGSVYQYFKAQRVCSSILRIMKVEFDMGMVKVFVKEALHVYFKRSITCLL